MGLGIMGMGLGLGLGGDSPHQTPHTPATSNPPTRTRPPAHPHILSLQSQVPRKLSSALTQATAAISAQRQPASVALTTTPFPTAPTDIHTVCFGPHSRVNVASRKNLVLEKAPPADRRAPIEWLSDTPGQPPVFSLGKVSEDEFSLFFHSISPFQAFVIGLAIFDH